MFKKIIISIIVIIIIFGLGFIVGRKFPRKIETPAGNQENSFQNGWDAARARLNQTMGAGRIFHKDDEFKNVSGIIQKINGNKLAVKIDPLEPLADLDLDTRIIAVDSNTKIFFITNKDPIQFQKEMQEFNDKMKNQITSTEPAQPIAPPIPFEKKEIKITDLKESQQVLITANENIKDKKEFVAVEIDAQEIVPVPMGELESNPAKVPVSPVSQ